MPNFCGISPEKANLILGLVRDVNKQKKIAPSPASKRTQTGQAAAPPPQHQHTHSYSQSSGHAHLSQLAPQLDNLHLDGQVRPPPSPTYGQQMQQQQQQAPGRGERPLPQTPGRPAPHEPVHAQSYQMSPPPPQQQQQRPYDPYAALVPPPQQASRPPPPQQPIPPPQQPSFQQQQPPSAPTAGVVARPSAASRRKAIGLEDFNFLTVLGKGNFGKVMLAEEKKSTKLYAIKVLKKEFIIENDEVDSTKSEKQVFLAAADRTGHPFLLNLHSCFQTETRIYFVMEYISGGDLMLHIQRKQFSVRQAKFYASEVLLALEYFHTKGIIYRCVEALTRATFPFFSALLLIRPHLLLSRILSFCRDLKLDNILLTTEGHIKVADYGLCKQDMWYGKTTTTFCGTPEFMAPEVRTPPPSPFPCSRRLTHAGFVLCRSCLSDRTRVRLIGGPSVC